MKKLEKAGLALVCFSILSFLFTEAYGYVGVERNEKVFLIVLIYTIGIIGIYLFAILPDIE